MAATALLLGGCGGADEAPGQDTGSASPPRVAGTAVESRAPADPVAVDPRPDPAFRRDLERYCTVHEAALAAIGDPPGDDALDGGAGDAVAVLLSSLEAVTRAVAHDLDDGGALHPRVQPLRDAAAATATGAREALEADRDARQAYLADQLAGASYLQPFADDPDLYAAVRDLDACADLPLGAVAAELHHGDDQHR